MYTSVSVMLLGFLLGVASCNYNPIRNAERTINRSLLKSISPTYKERFNWTIQRQRAVRKYLLRSIAQKYNIQVKKRLDTLILVESYNNMCTGCPANMVGVLINKHIYYINPSGYKDKTRFKDLAIKLDTLQFIKGAELRGFEKLYVFKSNSHPFDKSHYSALCFDGENANITWLLPNNSACSVNADCWW
ncbi:hypothetical protein [Fibrella aquatilis]|uniref:Uncharacterized protein n=1 Tax=Fibrella aquatilis TaxID=2817059 RepID=A0A939JYZ0_9BACT|nr:hypothetical protein [Fibrella aquatilis]MBO0929635.1 hypothetical protein [Fibrella aquatilis]